MFIIPCKFVENKNTIYECVQSIQKYYPNEKITIVNASSSDKKTYCDSLKIFDFIDTEQDIFEVGAYQLAFKKYPNELYYYCMQDSIILKTHFEPVDLRVVQYMSCCSSDPFFRRYDRFENISKVLGYDVPHVYQGVAYNTFFCHNNVMKKLMKNMEPFTPHSKYDSNITECLLGIMLNSFGFNLSTLNIQGLHYGLTYKYDNSNIEKRLLGRV